MTPDLVTLVRTCIAAASSARDKSEVLRGYYLGCARCGLVELRAAVEEMQRHLDALEAEIARTAAPRQMHLEGGAR